MEVFVTGGSGFLGSHIVEQLVAQGHSVRAFVRETSDRRFLGSLAGVFLHEGSLNDVQSLERAMRGATAVIHAAGLVKARSEDEFTAVNVHGAANVLAAALKQKNLSRFVLISSLAAVGPSVDGKPLLSDAPTHPVTHYGRTKLEAERLVMAAAGEIPVTVLRPPLIYGPRDKECLAFFKSVDTGILPFLGDGKNTLSVIYASDCARACVQAATRSGESGKAYFVEDGQIYVWRQMLEEIEQAMGKRARLRVPIPFQAVRAVAMGLEAFGKLTNRAVMLTRDKLNELAAPHWVCDGTEARRDLDWQPKFDWSQGVRETAKWYRSAGWL